MAAMSGFDLLAAALPRRRLLQLGFLGPMGLSRPVLGRDLGPAGGRRTAATFGRARRCILVFLNGGPSQLDTWDMKPDSPIADVRGELRPIPTKVPGIHVSELLPRLAAVADRYKIVRSVTHDASVHTTGMYTMLTGTYHATPKVDQTHIRPTDHPHLGAIYARWRGWRGGIPPFVALPTLFRAPPVDGIWPGQTAGFLGRRFDPLVLEGEKQTARFRSPESDLPDSMTAAKLVRRGELFQRLGAAQWRETAPATRAWDELYQQGWQLMDSAVLRTAVDLRREPPAVQD